MRLRKARRNTISPIERSLDVLHDKLDEIGEMVADIYMDGEVHTDDDGGNEPPNVTVH
jgi:hypothetical protein